MGVSGQQHVPAASTPGKDPVPILQEAGWAPGPVWTGEENLVPTGIRSRTVQPVVTEYLLFLSYFNVRVTWIFLTDFRKIIKYQISWKSVQWKPSRSMRADGRADMKLIVAFHDFPNSPTNFAGYNQRSHSHNAQCECRADPSTAVWSFSYLDKLTPRYIK